VGRNGTLTESGKVFAAFCSTRRPTDLGCSRAGWAARSATAGAGRLAEREREREISQADAIGD